MDRRIAPLPRPLRPITIAHRGASSYRPEHTLAAYELAITLGADFIEPDLVSTADGVLVARHESNIARTTDIAEHPEYAGRHTTKTIDGAQVTGWFCEDFTFDELRTLRAIERLPDLRPANRMFDGDFLVPSFEEILDLAAAHSTPERSIGLYPETKHPTYFRSLGLPLEPALLRDLDSRGQNHRDAKIFIQSFEVDNLRVLRRVTDVPLIQLVEADGHPAGGSAIDYQAMTTPAGLAQIATYADGIGPDKHIVHPGMVEDAHAVGLQVHPWTFRAENCFLAPSHRSSEKNEEHGDLAHEIRTFLSYGIDGIFCDFADIAVATINDLALIQSQ